MGNTAENIKVNENLRFSHYGVDTSIPIRCEYDDFVNAYKGIDKLKDCYGALCRNSYYTSYSCCFKLKEAGYNTKGCLYWVYDENNGRYYIMISSKTNEELTRNKAVIPTNYYDYLSFIYEYNEKEHDYSIMERY